MLHPRFLPLPFAAIKNRLPRGKRFFCYFNIKQEASYYFA
jgi:hypothetical protein